MSKEENKPAPAAESAGPQKLLLAGVVLILVALAGIVWLIASGRGGFAPANNTAEANAAAPEAPAAPAAPAGPPQAMPNRGELLPSGLRIETIRAGTGRPVTRADVPLVRYELRVLGRSEVIESNFADPQAIPMPLDGVVPGFAEALTHMRVGGESRFWVPPNLGYGSEPRPGAPFGPNDILEFRVRIDGLASAGRGGGAGAANSSNVTNAATETPTPVPGQ